MKTILLTFAALSISGVVYCQSSSSSELAKVRAEIQHAEKAQRDATAKIGRLKEREALLSAQVSNEQRSSQKSMRDRGTSAPQGTERAAEPRLMTEEAAH